MYAACVYAKDGGVNGMVVQVSSCACWAQPAMHQLASSCAKALWCGAACAAHCGRCCPVLSACGCNKFLQGDTMDMMVMAVVHRVGCPDIKCLPGWHGCICLGVAGGLRRSGG